MTTRQLLPAKPVSAVVPKLTLAHNGLLQRKSLNSVAGTRRNLPAPPIVHKVLRSSGHPLDEPVYAFGEPRFAHDFSKVRIHTDARAQTSLAAINANIVRNNIVLGEAITASTREPVLAQRINAAVRGGSRLDLRVQRQLEEGLGADLSKVRVHTDNVADELARLINAVAFTTGQDIFFRAGTYNPSSPEGMRLLAHEAVHTMQQTAGSVPSMEGTDVLRISDASDDFERAAKSAADAIFRTSEPRQEAIKPVSRGNSRLLQRQEGSAGPGPRQEYVTPASATVPERAATSPTPQAQTPGLGFKFNVDIEEVTLAEFGKANYFKGDVKLKSEASAELGGPVTAGPVVGGATPKIGIKADLPLAKQKVRAELFSGWRVEEVKEKFVFELSTEKLQIHFSVEAPIRNPRFPVLSGLAEGNFVLLAADWNKMSKNPDDVTVAAFKIGGGLTGDVVIPYNAESSIKAKVKVTIRGTVKPNLVRMSAEIAKNVAQGVAKSATKVAVGASEGGLAVDAAAVSSAAAAVAAPAAVALALGYGMFQSAKNTRGAVDAANAGVATRHEAKAVAKGYATVLTGGTNRGDPGSMAAEAQIIAIMAQTKATRQQVLDAIKDKQGGYPTIYEKELSRMRDILYKEAARRFDEGHQADFGPLERMGQDWGMRGVYRRTLRLILYSEE